jgi:predicted PurR-regulated permease PerM
LIEELEELKNLKKDEETSIDIQILLSFQELNKLLDKVYDKILANQQIIQQINEISKLVDINQQNYMHYCHLVAYISSECVRVLYKKFYDIITYLLTIGFVFFTTSFFIFFLDMKIIHFKL